MTARVLVVSNDRIGSRMAGPGIRYYHFARELAARGLDVTLLTPDDPDLDVPGVTAVLTWPGRTLRELKALVDGFDAVVAQQLPPRLMRHLARSRTRAIYDLYDPYVIENLGFYAAAGDSGPAARAEHRAGALLQEIALAAGDGFVCASERQRDLWLGVLATLGRLDFERYAADESLRDLIDVVPFGLESEPPRAAAPVLKGVLPGISPGDRVLLWGGGVWNWLDPLTPIRAVAQLGRPDVKLFFLGLERPNPAVARMSMAQQAVELARELGLLDRTVFFNFGWVPYGERQRYLLEADLGLTAHLDTVEARFAFRTRVLDYLWAGLPVVASAGDTLADLVAERELGRTVEPGDVDGWAEAIDGLLVDASAYETARRNLADVRDEFVWGRVVEPLVRLVGAGSSSGGPPAVRRADGLVLEHLAVTTRLRFHHGGARGLAAFAAAALAGKARLATHAAQRAIRR
jgi:glycosyltransferase involved in cell wall biosynthesis